MIHRRNRTIKVDKQKLIDKIKENKKNHIEEYANAVVAYKEEALKQLKGLTDKIKDGKLGIKLDLITPVDSAENYDKILEMFQWDVDTVVELGQDEFTEYVQDETDFAVTAKMSNTAYFMNS